MIKKSRPIIFPDILLVDRVGIRIYIFLERLMVTKQERGEGINQEVGINTHTLIYIK